MGLTARLRSGGELIPAFGNPRKRAEAIFLRRLHVEYNVFA